MDASLSEAFFGNFCCVKPRGHRAGAQLRLLLPHHPDRQLGSLFPEPSGSFAPPDLDDDPSEWAPAPISVVDKCSGGASTSAVLDEEGFDYELPPLMSLDDFLGERSSVKAAAGLDAEFSDDSEDENDMDNSCPMDRLRMQIASIVPFSPRPDPLQIFPTRCNGLPIPAPAIVRKKGDKTKKLFSVHFEDDNESTEGSTDCESGSTESGASEESTPSC